eukprot:365694-Chlamydomonas_euryale.AAC.11
MEHPEGVDKRSAACLNQSSQPAPVPAVLHKRLQRRRARIAAVDRIQAHVQIPHQQDSPPSRQRAPQPNVERLKVHAFVLQVRDSKGRISAAL